jgi:hypothetical protein
MKSQLVDRRASCKMRLTPHGLMRQFATIAYSCEHIPEIGQIFCKIDLRPALLSVLEHTFPSTSHFAS